MFRLLLWVVLILVIARIAWRMLAAVLDGMGYRAPGQQSASVGLVRDPVCGMFVAPTTALTSGSGSNTRYFCSEQCRREYAGRT